MQSVPGAPGAASGGSQRLVGGERNQRRRGLLDEHPDPLAVAIDPSLGDETEEHLHALRAELLAGNGSEVMPLGAYPSASLYA